MLWKLRDAKERGDVHHDHHSAKNIEGQIRGPPRIEPLPEPSFGLV